MRVRATLHGLFRVGIDSPDGRLELTLPEGASVAMLAQMLRETSPAIDPWACLAMIGGERVSLDRSLADGEEVHLYPLFSGG